MNFYVVLQTNQPKNNIFFVFLLQKLPKGQTNDLSRPSEASLYSLDKLLVWPYLCFFNRETKDL